MTHAIRARLLSSCFGGCRFPRLPCPPSSQHRIVNRLKDRKSALLLSSPLSIPHSLLLSTMSDLSSSIPVMRHPSNLMETGPNGNNLASAATRNHPIQELQRTTVERGFLDLDGVRRLYGSGLAMRLATERQLASRVGGRLPGMEQSNLILDTVTGNDVMLDFSDVLGRPEHAPVPAVTDPHTAMQRKLGL